jgi:mRNA interferase MazF
MAGQIQFIVYEARQNWHESFYRGIPCEGLGDVIVSNDAANHYLNKVQVVPLTSSVDKLYPSEAYVTFQGKKAKAMADQLTTVSKKRLINSAGSIPYTEMEGVGKAITTQLDL